ncbi:MAG TPA: kelch repeat-containing protein [Candidatus Limnocylindria bacterium]|nr:kelch repeat-containing protein [Candidatus Limnocylindria bacterium]
MTDERLFERLAAHGGPADVDPGFEDRLYALLQSEIRRPARSARPALLLVAALLAILAISAAVMIGSGVIELPWVVDGSPIPSPSAAASETSEPSPSVSVSSEPTWTVTASLAEGRSGHTATLLADGRVLVAGGSGPIAGAQLASAELYDPTTGTWTATGGMIEARVNHTATQLPDGRVLVAGGVGAPTSEFFASILASAELYDPRTGEWTSTGAMFDVRVGHTATLLPDGQVLVAGGGSSSDGDGGPLASAELYDAGTGQWTVTGSTTGAGPGREATLLADGQVLVVGGAVGDIELGGLAELYDPRTGSWSATATMVEVRFNHTATLLLDGRVLIAGSGTDLASTELYDPITGSWSASGAMLEVRIQHTATLLSDGTVLVAGSMSGSVAMPSAERYEAATGEWTATASMSDGRLGHTATRLLDGTVLVVGGTDSVIDGGVPLASAELYDPGSGF